MSQRSDFGAIANQQGAFYRGAVNANLQAIATQHYGAAEPPVAYPNMIWFSAGDGFIKVRSPTNTSWQSIGLIGPPMKWTNIDLPQEAFITGDIKETYNVNQSGWVHLNDGSIGNQFSGAQTRSNPDCWPLFNLLWAISSDDWCSVYAASTLTRTGRGSNAAADWNLNRHILLPKRLGRVGLAAGWGAGLSSWSLATWAGAEAVALSTENTPAHQHAFSAAMPTHSHLIQNTVDNFGASGSGSHGPGGNLRILDKQTNAAGAGTISGVTNSTGSGVPHQNMQPWTGVYFLIKL